MRRTLTIAMSWTLLTLSAACSDDGATPAVDSGTHETAPPPDGAAADGEPQSDASPCPAAMPQEGTACTLAQYSSCSYLKQDCPATPDDLFHHCSCVSGSWSCSEDYDCYPPSTCVGTDGCNCVDMGLVNTDPSGADCPADTTIGVCTAHPCTASTTPVPDCTPVAGAGPDVPASCLYEQWTCQKGYALALCK